MVHIHSTEYILFDLKRLVIKNTLSKVLIHVCKGGRILYICKVFQGFYVPLDDAIIHYVNHISNNGVGLIMIIAVDC